MAIGSGKRFLDPVPILVDREWRDVSRDLQQMLEKLSACIANTSFAFFSNTPPEQIQAGVDASPGTETFGVAPTDHTHDVLTGVPVDIGTENEEGTSNALSRSDHVHGSSFGDTTVEVVNGLDTTFTYAPSTDELLTDIYLTLLELVELERER